VILGIAGALVTGSHVEAKSAKGRHTRCATKSKAGSTKPHANCKKPNSTETQPNSSKTALKIVRHPYDGFAELTYTLNCDPASGTLLDPAAACAEISRYPGMVFEGALYAGSCGVGTTAGLSVTGEYEGRPVNVEFFTCSERDT
jgi:hypothetical protein